MKALRAAKMKAIQLASKPALNFFELAGLITALHEADPAELRDLPTEGGMSRRRLYYLLSVGQLIRKYTINKAEAEQVGWTKLQIIAHFVAEKGDATDDQLAAYMNLALASKSHPLAQLLRGRRVPHRRAVQFKLSLRAGDELNQALFSYGAKRRNKGKSLLKKEAALIAIVRAAMTSKS